MSKKSQEFKRWTIYYVPVPVDEEERDVMAKNLPDALARGEKLIDMDSNLKGMQVKAAKERKDA